MPVAILDTPNPFIDFIRQSLDGTYSGEISCLSQNFDIMLDPVELRRELHLIDLPHRFRYGKSARSSARHHELIETSVNVEKANEKSSITGTKPWA